MASKPNKGIKITEPNRTEAEAHYVHAPPQPLKKKGGVNPPLPPHGVWGARDYALENICRRTIIVSIVKRFTFKYGNTLTHP